MQCASKLTINLIMIKTILNNYNKKYDKFPIKYIYIKILIQNLNNLYSVDRFVNV